MANIPCIKDGGGFTTKTVTLNTAVTNNAQTGVKTVSIDLKSSFANWASLELWKNLFISPVNYWMTTFGSTTYQFYFSYSYDKTTGILYISSSNATGGGTLGLNGNQSFNVSVVS